MSSEFTNLHLKEQYDGGTPTSRCAWSALNGHRIWPSDKRHENTDLGNVALGIRRTCRRIE
jgi:hypothetical protein